MEAIAVSGCLAASTLAKIFSAAEREGPFLQEDGLCSQRTVGQLLSNPVSSQDATTPVSAHGQSKWNTDIPIFSVVVDLTLNSIDSYSYHCYYNLISRNSS